MQADRGIERRMMELATRAARTGIRQVAWFLSPAEQAQADICARAQGVCLQKDGGVEDAERCVVAFADTGEADAWPIACVRVGWHADYGAPTHRDLLGSVLGLGIGREKVGDVFVEAGQAYVLVLRDMAEYIAANLTRAGRVSVRAQVVEDWPRSFASEGEPVRGTVASLRLDAVLGVAWHLSRGRAAELVASGRVRVDHREELRPDRQLAPGALLSVRGLGRARLETVGGNTKKGRISITLLRY